MKIFSVIYSVFFISVIFVRSDWIHTIYVSFPFISRTYSINKVLCEVITNVEVFNAFKAYKEVIIILFSPARNLPTILGNFHNPIVSSCRQIHAVFTSFFTSAHADILHHGKCSLPYLWFNRVPYISIYLVMTSWHSSSIFFVITVITGPFFEADSCVIATAKNNETKRNKR